MNTISLSLAPVQDLVALADVIDRVSQNHVTGADKAARKADLERLINNLLFIKASKAPEDAAEWARLTETHYEEADRRVAEGVAELDAEWSEHMLTGHEYGLTRAA